MIAYKLVKLRKNGTIGPLFINKKQILLMGATYTAEDHPTKGYKHRPGWHCLKRQHAPHLTTKGRVWIQVLISDFTTETRPESQGGEWYLAEKMTVLKFCHGY